MSLRSLSATLAIALVLAGCRHMAAGPQPIEPLAVGHPPVERVDVLVTHGEPRHPPMLPQGPQVVADEESPYLLDTGDRLRVFVYGQPNLSRVYPVDDQGLITVPLIGAVRVRGMSTFAVEKLVKRKLAADFVRDPQVTVDIAQTRPFFILGEVRNAGQYSFVAGMTVQSAVAIAGGYSERASQRRVTITRRINGVVEKMDVPTDYVLKAGDTIYVHERFL